MRSSPLVPFLFPFLLFFILLSLSMSSIPFLLLRLLHHGLSLLASMFTNILRPLVLHALVHIFILVAVFMISFFFRKASKALPTLIVCLHQRNNHQQHEKESQIVIML